MRKKNSDIPNTSKPAGDDVSIEERIELLDTISEIVKIEVDKKFNDMLVLHHDTNARTYHKPEARHCCLLLKKLRRWLGHS